MRNISANAMAQITTARGGEPLIVVECIWDGAHSWFYCDRGAFFDLPQLEGKILELGHLEDVVSISGSSSSQSITIKLDDIDQTIKNLYNVIDFHFKLVNVYQWFTELSFDDKFIIFEGYVNTPIAWSEKDRTLSFEVISKVEDQEIGFSAEEGDFPTLPDDLIGKAWPLPFGSPLKVPSLRFDIVSSAIIMDSFGVHDPALNAQLFNLFQQESAFSANQTTKSLQAADVQAKAGTDAENAFTLAQVALDLNRLNTATADTIALAVIQEEIDLITQAGGSPSDELTQAKKDAEDKITADSAAADAADAANSKALTDAIQKADDVNLATNNALLKADADQGNTINNDLGRLERQLGQEQSFEITSVTLFNGSTFPQNQTALIEVGPLILTVTITPRNNSDGRGDSTMTIISVARKVPVTYSYSGGQIGIYNFYGNLEIDQPATPVSITVHGGGFAFIKAGTAIKWLSPLPTRYIAAMLPCTVVGLYATRDFNQTKLLTSIPSGGTGDTLGNITAATPFGEILDGSNPFVGVNTALAGFAAGDNILTPGTGLPNNHYYDVSIQQFGDYDVAPFLATVITLVRPMTYWDEGWEDTIYADLISPVGPNTVDIITWLIQTYTKFGIDSASFATVRAQVNNFASHFCLFDRKNIIQVLGEIAYQARCAIWLKNRIFYMRYLVPEPDAVDTITLDDIIFGSLELDCTPTENLVTKLMASYKMDYGPLRDSEKGSGTDKVILRNNQGKYGLHIQDYDWYSYNNPSMVDLAATFWLIRKSNTWKLVKFKTPLHKLQLESFDPVAINFASNWVCTGMITGLINSTHLNSDTMEIEFEVWMPVRLGEMTQYDFAWPVDSTFLFYPTILDQPGSSGPGITASGDISSARPSGGTTFPMNKGIRQAIDSGSPTPGQTEPPENSPPAPITPMGNLDGRTDPGFLPFQPTPTDPVTGLVPPADATAPADSTSTAGTTTKTPTVTFPAQIVSGPTTAGTPPQPGSYVTQAYTQGLTQPPITWTAVDASYDAENNSTPVEPDTWVMVCQLVWTTGDAGAAAAAAAAYAAAMVASQQALKKAQQASAASATATAFANANPGNSGAQTGVQAAQQAATDALAAVQSASDVLTAAAQAFTSARVQTNSSYLFVPGTPGASTFPGVVQSGSGSGPYVVNVYMEGLNGTPQVVNFVKQLQITGDNVPAGTWALIAKGTKKDSGTGKGSNGNPSDGGPNSAVEYTMQVPVWVG